MSDQLRATVREIDGQIILDDPDALAMITAIGKRNCRTTFMAQLDVIRRFAMRATERGDSINDVVIVLINVDDANGQHIAPMLMPDHCWQQYRDRCEVPFARGLAGREGIQAALDIIDEDAASKLRAMTELAVIVIDHSTADVYPASLVAPADNS